MPAERLSMRKDQGSAAASCRRAVRSQDRPDCRGGRDDGSGVSGPREAGRAWPLPAELDDETLERRLFPPAAAPSARPQRPPDWAAVHQEMRRRGVTLQLLWQ